VTKEAAIVRDLAKKEPVWWVRKSIAMCALCDGTNNDGPKAPVEHTTKCPWRRAKELTDA
jgi:hypothetical protein